jgi:hypothetical protein
MPMSFSLRIRPHQTIAKALKEPHDFHETGPAEPGSSNPWRMATIASSAELDAPSFCLML